MGMFGIEVAAVKGGNGWSVPSDALGRAGPDRRKPSRWAALLGGPIPGDLPSPPATRVQRTVVLGLIIAIFVFATSSHQLTPFFMFAACTGLVIIRRCQLPGLPVLLAVIFAGWVSFATVAYWSGHFSVIFGGFGDLFSNVSSGVSGRMAGSAALHSLVLYARVAFAGTVMILAVAGWTRRRRLGIDDRVALLLIFVPFTGFALQGYGGEMALRVYLFALPGASVLAACLFFPGPAAVRRAGRRAPRRGSVRGRGDHRVRRGALRQRGLRADAAWRGCRDELCVRARQFWRQAGLAGRAARRRCHAGHALAVPGH